MRDYGEYQKQYQRKRYKKAVAAGKCASHPWADAATGKRQCNGCIASQRKRGIDLKAGGKCRAHPSVSVVPGSSCCETCLWRAIKNNTGWTRDQYEAAYEEQHGRCAICERPGARVASGHPSKSECLFGDHDHDTGAPRGLLCMGCNSAIGYLKEDHRRIRPFVDRVLSYIGNEV